jgi:hypothetical protein
MYEGTRRQLFNATSANPLSHSRASSLSHIMPVSSTGIRKHQPAARHQMLSSRVGAGPLAASCLGWGGSLQGHSQAAQHSTAQHSTAWVVRRQRVQQQHSHFLAAGALSQKGERLQDSGPTCS